MLVARHDKYLRHVKDFGKPPLGLVVEDLVRQFPGPCLARTRDVSVPARWVVGKREPDTILCKGACAGISETGICYHARRGLQFLGFIEANLSQARVSVMVQGAVELSIANLNKDSIGKELYASGPDQFNTDGEGPCVGRIFYISNLERGRAMCVFQKGSSKKQLVLDLIGQSAKFI